MICGNCKLDHETVQQVKDCYGKNPNTADPSRIELFGATKPQMKYISNLLAELDMTPLADDARMSKHEASEMIEDLKRTRAAHRQQAVAAQRAEQPGVLFTDGEEFTISQIKSEGARTAAAMVAGYEQQRKRTPQSSDWELPAGHYAIPAWVGYSTSPRSMDQDLNFYRVDKPEDGKWKGYTFVKWVIGGKPDAPLRGKQRIYAVLRYIEEHTDEAGQKYGQEIGRCYRCNRHLTDKTSRELGIGPDCRSRDIAA
jgi:hypothetical protein